MKIKIAVILSLLSCPALAQTYEPYRSYTPPPAYNPPVYTPPTTYQSFGNRTYGSDGTTVQTFGGTTYIDRPNGAPQVVCRKYGSTTYCQ